MSVNSYDDCDGNDDDDDCDYNDDDDDYDDF